MQWGVCLDAGGRRMRNRGGDGWWPGHILNIIDGITDGMILFVTLLAIMSVISLVYIDGMFMSVYTDNFSEEKILLVNITAKDWQKKPSAIPFVFVQFYRYFNSSSTNLPTESNRRWIVISPTE